MYITVLIKIIVYGNAATFVPYPFNYYQIELIKTVVYWNGTAKAILKTDKVFSRIFWWLKSSKTTVGNYRITHS